MNIIAITLSCGNSEIYNHDNYKSRDSRQIIVQLNATIRRKIDTISVIPSMVIIEVYLIKYINFCILSFILNFNQKFHNKQHAHENNKTIFYFKKIYIYIV